MTKTVDISIVNAGDTVKLRCGGEVVVNNIQHMTSHTLDNLYRISIEGMHHKIGSHRDDCNGFAYFSNGDCASLFIDAYNHCPFDIVCITHSPFSWRKVKQGMCFKDRVGDITIFVAHHLTNDAFVVTNNSANNDYVDRRKSYLTRYPEGDLK